MSSIKLTNIYQFILHDKWCKTMNAQNIGDKVNFTAVSLTTNTSNKRIALQYLEIAPGPGC